VLDDEQYRQLSAVAHSLNMGVLTEVSNEEELERAIALKAKVVGINNRDLRDMSIDLNRTRSWRRARSRCHGDQRIRHPYLRRSARTEPLRQRFPDWLRADGAGDLNAAVKRVLLGENKVCGLTRPRMPRWRMNPARFTAA
jgi:indole-3-glycerol phosphate synthase/phosphoribosylanthranilate isomerase